MAPEGFCFRRQQALSRVVAQKNLSVGADDYDGSRTALDHNVQLLFCFLPPLHLVSQCPGVLLQCEIPVVNELGNEQPCANERDGTKYKVYVRLIFGEIAEIQNSAQQSDDDNRFARQESRRDHNRKKV